MNSWVIIKKIGEDEMYLAGWVEKTIPIWQSGAPDEREPIFFLDLAKAKEEAQKHGAVTLLIKGKIIEGKFCPDGFIKNKSK